MGPFNEYHKDQKVREKENARSRIPRLVLRPCRPKHRGSPSSESPFSEEERESRDYQPSSAGHSPRGVSSSLSFCSDDTGCPSSQSVSPVKSPSKLASSPLAFPAVNEEEEGGRKLNSGIQPEWNTQHFRNKKDQKLCLVQPGSEADFSSSSSTGSISAPEGLMSNTGSKRSSASRSRGVYGRSNAPSGHKQPGSPIIPREKDAVLSVYRNTAGIRDTYGASSRSSSSNSGSYKGSDSSPTIRRAGKYTSCSDNHGIKPPNPEQYLTPLQQKEVTIRHLRTKLKESENNLQERESEVVDLKSQLARMREDWIEEECHRVEAQLALKEARKEIKQLRQVIDTMKNSLVEKDKGVQKYFIDINIQNKKLESLLQSMEMAQNGAVRDDQAVDYMCTSPVKALARSTTYTKMTEGTGLEDQAIEAMADSGLLVNDDMASRADLFDQILKSTAIEGVSGGVSWAQGNEMPVKLVNSATFDISAQSGLLFMTDDNRLVREQAIQTDLVPYGPDVQKLILHLLKSQDSSPVSPISSNWMSDAGQAACAPKLDAMITNALVDLTPNNPNNAILVSKSESVILLNSPETCNYSEQTASSPRISNMIDLNFALEIAGNERSVSREHLLEQPSAVCERSYWSNHFIIDLLAVAVPVVPTLAWVVATHRGGMDPLYNIGTLMRGCCLLALHSLRRSPRTLFHRPSNAQNPTNCT